MKFDSNRAWKHAARLVSANRDVLAALAGVFFLLPSFASALLLPQPPPPPGADAAAVMLAARDYYLSHLPLLLPMLLLQVLAGALGWMVMLALFTDQARPTVGQALRAALPGVLPYVAAQVLIGVGLAVVISIAGWLAVLSRSNTLVIMVAATIVVAAVYVWVKTLLVAPVIAAEHARNPVTAIVRSWQLTKDNSVRIALFYVLIGVVFGVIAMVTMALVGIVLGLVAATQPVIAGSVAALVSSTLTAVASVYLVATLAAVHRQLAGRSPGAESAPFA